MEEIIPTLDAHTHTVLFTLLLLTCEFPIDHDVQVFLWVGADISGDGVEADGGVLQGETHP